MADPLLSEDEQNIPNDISKMFFDYSASYNRPPPVYSPPPTTSDQLQESSQLLRNRINEATNNNQVVDLGSMDVNSPPDFSRMGPAQGERVQIQTSDLRQTPPLPVSGGFQNDPLAQQMIKEGPTTNTPEFEQNMADLMGYGEEAPNATPKMNINLISREELEKAKQKVFAYREKNPKMEVTNVDINSLTPEDAVTMTNSLAREGKVPNFQVIEGQAPDGTPVKTVVPNYGEPFTEDQKANFLLDMNNTTVAKEFAEGILNTPSELINGATKIITGESVGDESQGSSNALGLTSWDKTSFDKLSTAQKFASATGNIIGMGVGGAMIEATGAGEAVATVAGEAGKFIKLLVPDSVKTMLADTAASQAGSFHPAIIPDAFNDIKSSIAGMNPDTLLAKLAQTGASLVKNSPALAIDSAIFEYLYNKGDLEKTVQGLKTASWVIPATAGLGTALAHGAEILAGSSIGKAMGQLASDLASKVFNNPKITQEELEKAAGSLDSDMYDQTKNMIDAKNEAILARQKEIAQAKHQVKYNDIKGEINKIKGKRDQMMARRQELQDITTKNNNEEKIRLKSKSVDDLLADKKDLIAKRERVKGEISKRQNVNSELPERIKSIQAKAKGRINRIQNGIDKTADEIKGILDDIDELSGKKKPGGAEGNPDWAKKEIDRLHKKLINAEEKYTKQQLFGKKEEVKLGKIIDAYQKKEDIPARLRGGKAFLDKKIYNINKEISGRRAAGKTQAFTSTETRNIKPMKSVHVGTINDLNVSNQTKADLESAFGTLDNFKALMYANGNKIPNGTLSPSEVLIRNGFSPATAVNIENQILYPKYVENGPSPQVELANKFRDKRIDDLSNGIDRAGDMIGRRQAKLVNMESHQNYNPNVNMDILKSDEYTDLLNRYTIKLKQKGINAAVTGKPLNWLQNNTYNQLERWDKVQQATGIATHELMAQAGQGQHLKNNLIREYNKLNTPELGREIDKMATKQNITENDLYTLMHYIYQDGDKVVFNPAQAFYGATGEKIPEYKGPVPTKELMDKLFKIRETWTSLHKMVTDSGRDLPFLSNWVPKLEIPGAQPKRGSWYSKKTPKEQGLLNQRLKAMLPDEMRGDYYTNLGLITDKAANNAANAAAFTDVIRGLNSVDMQLRMAASAKALQNIPLIKNGIEIKGKGNSGMAKDFSEEMAKAMGLKTDTDIREFMKSNAEKDSQKWKEHLIDMANSASGKGLTEKTIEDAGKAISDTFYGSYLGVGKMAFVPVNGVNVPIPVLLLQHLIQPTGIAAVENGLTNVAKAQVYRFSKAGQEELAKVGNMLHSPEYEPQEGDYNYPAFKYMMNLITAPGVPVQKGLKAILKANREISYLSALANFKQMVKSGTLNEGTAHLLGSERDLIKKIMIEKGIDAAGQQYGLISSTRANFAYHIWNKPKILQNSLGNLVPMVHWPMNTAMRWLNSFDNMGRKGGTYSLGKKIGFAAAQMYFLQQAVGKFYHPAPDIKSPSIGGKQLLVNTGKFNLSSDMTRLPDMNVFAKTSIFKKLDTPIGRAADLARQVTGKDQIKTYPPGPLLGGGIKTKYPGGASITKVMQVIPGDLSPSKIMTDIGNAKSLDDLGNIAKKLIKTKSIVKIKGGG